MFYTTTGKAYELHAVEAALSDNSSYYNYYFVGLSKIFLAFQYSHKAC